jgi:transcriptional regulator with XRE-family HTH domain
VAIISSHPGPLARRRQLGAALRQYRLESGLGLAEVAGKLLQSPSKISRIETAQRSISARDVRDLLDIYRVTDPTVREQLMKLVEESRESAWWASYNLDPSYSKMIGLESASTTISIYQLGPIPGLLQTPEYAKAMVSAWTDNPRIIKEAADVRIARQQHVNPEAALNFVIDESVLYRSIGGRAVLHGQIKKLISVSGDPRVELQVFPFSAGAHQGLVGGFTILQFSDSKIVTTAANLPDIVYHEGVIGSGTYLEQPDIVEGYLQAFRRLQEKSLAQHATITFLQSLLRDA